MESPAQPNNPSQQQADDLLTTQKLLKATLDASTDMIQVFEAVRNQQGQIIDFIWILNNHTSETIYGDVVGKSLLQLQPGVVEEGIFDAFKHVVETGEPQHYEKHYVHEQFDGWFHQSVVKLNDGVATTTADITLRKTAQQQLQQSQAFLQSVIDSSLDIIQVFKAVQDEAGQILDFVWVMNNQRAVAQNGEVIGKSLLELNPGVVPTGIFDHLVEVAQTGLAYEHEQYYQHEQFDGWFYQALVKTEDGVAMTTRDITQAKRAEQQILRLNDEVAQTATSKYESIFNSIDEGFYLCEVLFDEAGNPVDILYLEENPAAIRMIGQSFVGKRLRDISPLYEEYWYQIWGDAALTGDSQRMERYSEADQKWFNFLVSKFGGEDSRQVTVTFQDITELKRREASSRLINEVTEQLLQGEQLVESINSTCQTIGLYFGATVCAFSELDEEQGTVQAPYLWHVPGATAPTGVYRISEYHSDQVQQLMRSNQPEIVPTTHDFPDAVAARYQALGIGSYVNLPFVRDGKWRATLSITKAQPYPWHPDEIDLMRDLMVRIRTKLERVRAEEALQKSEEKYRTLFETMEEALAVVEVVRDDAGAVIDLTYLAFNPAHQRQTGLDGPTLIGRKLSQVLTQSDVDRFIPIYTQVANTGEAANFEEYVEFTDSWYAASVYPRGDELSIFYRDITERKRQEQGQAFLLQFSDQLRQQVTPEAVATCALEGLIAHLRLDRSYIVSYYLEKNIALLDYQIGNETVPPLPQTFDLPDYPEAYKAILDQTLVIDDDFEREGLSETEKQTSARLGMRAMVAATLRKGENKPLWSMVAINSTPRRWRVDEIQLIEDVAERTWTALERAKAEEALRQADERFRTFANTAPVLLWETDADGLMFTNQHYLDFFGVDFNDLRQMGWARFLHPDDAAGYLAAYQQAFMARQPYVYECRFRRADGHYRWLFNTGRPLNSHHFVGACIDITANKEAEAVRQEADRRKDEFLAMLAHELRNPMSTIRSGLAILDLTSTEDMTRSTVDMMSRQTEHLVRMVDDLLDVSRISRGKIDLKKERINLVELVSQAVESVRALYQEQGRRLQVDLPTAPIYLEGDATRLTQVVANLLTNGARYTGEQGQVWLSLTHKGKEAILQVRDNGIGLPADQLSSIFELFVQVDNSLARSKGGLGLGLTLVKRLVNMHGGQVKAQSEGLGKGSTFIVHLPMLTTAAEQNPKPTPQMSNPAAAKRILVIDDNADAAFTLGMLLKLKGYEAHTQNSGRSGIEAAESLQPSAILLDIGMPGMDGYATCRAIRQQAWGQVVVVIALTGYGQDEDRQRTREAGFDGHLVKPVDLGELTKTLTDLLNKE